jgi:microcystin-dependent protein
MSDPYVGEIRMFSGNFPPLGWALCDGSLLNISENDVLFQLMGTTYGGDGQSTFALPDLRGRLPLHAGTNPSTNTTYPLGQMGGTETVTLTVQQLPAHTHAVGANSNTADSSTPLNNVWAASGAKSYTASSPNGTMNPAIISYQGGNQPHDNMMPFLTISFIIALQGLYPSQT